MTEQNSALAIESAQNNDFLTYYDLLELAYRKNLVSMDVEILSYPTPENSYQALAKIVCQTSDGETFTEIGGANSDTCNSRDSSHLINRAILLSKIKGLKDLTCTGKTIREEIEAPRKRSLFRSGLNLIRKIQPTLSKMKKEEYSCKYYACSEKRYR